LFNWGLRPPIIKEDPMKSDKMVNYITLAVCIIFMAMTFTISDPVSRGDIGPKAWPRLLAGLMIVLSIFNIIITIKNSNKNNVEGSQQENKDESEDNVLVYPQNLWISLLSLSIYAFAINYLGFVVSTSLFVITNMYIMGLKNKKNLVIISVFIVAMLVIIFPILLRVPLPRGISIFNDISRIFY
jgi:hypothetical protein